MLNRRRFALNFATTVAVGLTPLAAAPLAQAQSSVVPPDSYRASPRSRGGRGRPRYGVSPAPGKPVPGPRANPHEQSELRPGVTMPGVVTTAAK